MNPRDKRVAAYVGGLFVTAAALAAVTGRLGRSAVAPLEIVTLTGLLIAAEYMIVRYRFSEDIDGVNLFDAALAPMVFAFPGPLAIAAVGLAQVVAAFARRNTLLKGSFNVAQWMSATGAGSLVFLGLRSGPALSPRNVVALIVALLVVSLVNQIAFTNVMRIVQGQRWATVARRIAPLFFATWRLGQPLNLAFGLLFTAAMQWSRWAAFLCFVPLVALHWAHRAYAAVATDRARLAGMHRAARVLSEPVDVTSAIEPFLAEVKRCFDAEAAELIVDQDGRRTIYLSDDSFTARTFALEDAGRRDVAGEIIAAGTPARITPKHPWASVLGSYRDAIVAPLARNDTGFGWLATYNRSGTEGFEEGELHVLQALAAESSSALEKSRLVGAMFDERRKLSEIVGNANDGIATLGMDGNVITWNPGFERISGYPANEMEGTRNIALLMARDAQGTDISLTMWAKTASGLPSSFQITGRTGEVRWLSCAYSTVPGAGGDPAMLIIIARDVTAEREVERLKDDFIATVSHELRTPLTPIKAWASTLLNLGDGLPAEQRLEGLRSMLRQTDRLERLITNLLQVSKVERGVDEQRDQLVDANLVVEKVVAEIRLAHPTREIVVKPVPSWSKARGEEMWIEQILGNLLSNAIKYAPSDEPIEVAVHSSPDRVGISVTDHGPGIPEIDQDKIFDRFHRLGDHMTRSQGGAGLGLYIARQLAKSIGASISVQSIPGERTTFSVSLRAADRLVVVA